ncbi:hypothetical protein BGX26_003466, partial [Mortierella sp. AD094]
MKAHKLSTVRQVIALLEQDKSIRQVSQELNIPRSTVHEMSQNFPVHRVKSKGGCPKKLANQDAFFLRVLLKHGELNTAVGATQHYNKENLKDIG